MKRMAMIVAGALIFGAAPGAFAQDMNPVFQRSAGIVVKPLFNQPTSQTFTMVGFEMLGGQPVGWRAGMGWYGGLDLGIKSFSSLLKYGGFLMRGDVPLGPLALTGGLLAGFGWTSNIYPNVSFSNTFLFGALEPQIGLSQVMDNGARLGIDFSYLLTSVPNSIQGPAIAIRFSMPFGHHRMMR